jgi:ABC-2 type transport system ATP-binding protein
VAFIRHGEVVRLLELSTLAAGQTTVTIRARGLTPPALQALKQWSSGTEPGVDGETIIITIPSDTVLPEITRCLVAYGADVYAITPQRMSLEDIFIETVGKDGGL